MSEKELFGISEQLDDTISRAAVVDEIEGVDWYHINRNGEMVHGANDAEHQAWYKADDIYAAIERVPSAQPVAKDINVPVKDCISRATAIETVRRAKSIGQAHRMLAQLPSAQPDIVACGDCIHWICHDRRCGYWNHGVKPLDWCCHAERRSDG